MIDESAIMYSLIHFSFFSFRSGILGSKSSLSKVDKYQWN